MRIVWIGLLLLACGQPQAGQVYSDASQAMVLGLMQNDGGAYELQLCKDGATGARKRQKAFTSEASECANPLVTADGEAYSFNIRGKSWLAQSLRWGAALLAGIVGGAVVFKAGRYFVRKGAAADLARELKATDLQAALTKQGDEMPEALQHALRRGRLSDRDTRKLLTLLDQNSPDIKHEASLLVDWNKHVAKLRDALQQGKVFVFKEEFDTSLTILRSALQKLPPQRQTLVELDQLTEALRRNKLSKGQALRKLTALEQRVQRQVGKLIEKNWDEALQQARHALEHSKDFDGRPAVQKGLQTMRRPLAKLDEEKSTRRLQRLTKDGTRRADKIKEEIDTVLSKIEAIRTRHLRAAAVRSETEGKLNHRDELLRVLQDLELVARNLKRNSRARKLKALAKDIQKGKADQGEIAKRMNSIDRYWQQVKNSNSADAWQRGLGEIDAILTADRSINDYKQLQVALRELQHLLQEIGDRGNARKISKLESKMTKRLGRKRSVSSRELDNFSEQAMEVANRSRKHNKLQKTVKQLEQGSDELSSGLEDSGIVRPKHALQRSLNMLESVLQKLAAEDELALLRELQADIAAKRLSREDLESSLTALDDILHHGEQATAFNRWQTSVTQVKATLNSGSSLFELDPNLAGIWDDMTRTLQASKVRETLAAEVEELQRYTLDGNWQEGALSHKLKQLDARVRKTGGFRTADELDAVQGKERRAAQRELRQRIAQLRSEQRTEVKRRAASLGAALREGEKTRKAAQGRFAWFNYGDGGERVIDREQVLAALRNGQQPDAIEVRMGLEKLAAQLTGATIFVALPFVLADNEAPQSDEQQELLPLLQQVAQAVDARITPAANCLLGSCATGD